MRLAVRVSGPQVPPALGASVYVNLWSGGISNGTLLAASSANYFDPGFTGYTNFFFPTQTALVPGTTYFLQPFVVPGGGFPSIATFSPSSASSDPLGMAIINGVVSPNEDMWYREGIVVAPEPSSGGLLLVAAFIWILLTCRPKRLSPTNAPGGTIAPAGK